MKSLTNKLRLSNRITAILCVASMLSALSPSTVYAATQDATFELHPHCSEREGNDGEWVFGPIPSPGIVANTRGDGITCGEFEKKDDQTVQTPPLNEGDILDIDVVIDNPSAQKLKRVRAWLSYDPNLLEGQLIEIHDAKFPLVTPDENDFSESEGYAKMEASAEGNGPDNKRILFARLQFLVKKTNSIGTPITFHDVQPSGHSVIMAQDGDGETYIVKEEPGVLLVRFTEDGEVSDDPTEDIEDPQEDDVGNIFDTETPPPPPPAPEEEPEPEPEPEQEEPVDDNSCVRNEDCSEDQMCIAGECAQKPAKKPNGAVCSEDAECESGLCGSGICIPNLSDGPQNTPPPINEDSSGTKTSFSLLQIQNLRATTEGSSVFLAWDKLISHQIKAYNIYYGTTSGRYIQRRTIDKSENSITLRSLIPGTKYFAAVRGLSTADEESAFSREVSIVVGDPDSSTAPLVPGSITDAPIQNPVGNLLEGDDTIAPIPVPGETGIPSVLALFAVLSAVIGTAFASQRQLFVSPKGPHA